MFTNKDFTNKPPVLKRGSGHAEFVTRTKHEAAQQSLRIDLAISRAEVIGERE
jgi:hypothetical protein